MIAKYNVADEFVDQELERSLLVAISTNRDVYFTVIDWLAVDTFAAYATEFEQLAAAIEDNAPLPPIIGEPAIDPLTAAKKLADLYQKRLLAATVQDILQKLRGEETANQLRNQLEEGLQRVDQAVRQIRTGQLSSIRDLLPGVFQELYERYKTAQESDAGIAGIPSGIAGLDSFLGGLSNVLVLLAGPPGMGKTSLALKFLSHAACSGYTALMVTHEEGPQRLAGKCIATAVGLELKRFNDGLSDPRILEEAAARLPPGLFDHLFIHEGNSRTTVNEVKAKFLQMQTRTKNNKGGLIVIDYLQRACAGIEAEGEYRHALDAYLAQVQEHLVKRLNVPVVVLAAQNRTGQGSSSVTSIRDSSGAEYTGDIVCLLVESDRVAYEPERAIDIIIGKNRRGGLGSVPLVFNAALGTFSEAPQQ